MMRLEGVRADAHEVDAAAFGQSLLGLQRFLQLSHASYHKSALKVPVVGGTHTIRLRLRTVTSGSVQAEIGMYLLDAAVQGVIAAIAWEMILQTWNWSRKLHSQMIHVKRSKLSLESAVEVFEGLAKSEGIGISRDRGESEEFVESLSSALIATTEPLESSAAKQVLSIPGHTTDIVTDSRGRFAICMPFAATEVSDDEPVIEVPVKFIRINKKTGRGIMSFVRPSDESQMNEQRFLCEDRSLRRRANPYTGAFHHDDALVVRTQRRAYEKNRRGHYWLILGIGGRPASGGELFERKRNR